MQSINFYMIFTIFDGLSTHLQTSKISPMLKFIFNLLQYIKKGLDLGHNIHAKNNVNFIQKCYL